MHIKPTGDWEAWLATRPEKVQALAREFPLGTEILEDGVVRYLIGYTEDDLLIVSKTNPTKNYRKAYRNREYVHADCLRYYLRQGELAKRDPNAQS